MMRRVVSESSTTRIRRSMAFSLDIPEHTYNRERNIWKYTLPCKSARSCPLSGVRPVNRAAFRWHEVTPALSKSAVGYLAPCCRQTRVLPHIH
jgi:hypothetical protein